MRNVSRSAALLLVVAAIAATLQPATAAENIYAGEVCTDKVFWNQSHLCGYAPGTGKVLLTNVGVHKVSVFVVPAWVDTSLWNGEIFDIDSSPMIAFSQFIDNIPVGGVALIPVNATDEVYVGRSDGTRSYRTITIRFDAVPALLLGAPPGGTGLLPEQKIEAVLDALTCPAQGQPGALAALGITITVDATTRFEAESCADLAKLVASGVRFLVDVTIREDAAGALTATGVELAPGAGGRARSRKWQ
jgi:hypothetical protein